MEKKKTLLALEELSGIALGGNPQARKCIHGIEKTLSDGKAGGKEELRGVSKK